MLNTNTKTRMVTLIIYPEFLHNKWSIVFGKNIYDCPSDTSVARLVKLASKCNVGIETHVEAELTFPTIHTTFKFHYVANWSLQKAN